MDNIIRQMADRFGLDEDKAAELADHLESQGHDLPSLLEDDDAKDKVKDLLGDRAEGFLGGISGLGGLAGNLFSRKSKDDDDSEDDRTESDDDEDAEEEDAEEPPEEEEEEEDDK